MIYIGSDHAGFEMKKYIKSILDAMDFKYTDQGAEEYTKGDDYTDYGHKVCEKIQDGDYGILICDTGIGMSIVANRYKNIRAALCSSIFDSLRAREHNNANVLVLGAETATYDDVKAMVRVFLETPFSNDERHIRRLNKI